MTMLWLVFMALILATIAMVLLPFIKGAAGDGDERPARVDYDIVVYRSQLSEIDQEIEHGTLTPEQADAARAEIHRRMLAAEDAELANLASLPVPGSNRLRLAAIVAVALVIPLGSVAIYGALGSPTLPGQPYAWRLKNDANFVASSTAEKLAGLLQNNPSGAGYKRLGEMYFDARDFAKAADADRRAVELGARDAATWSELGEAIVMASGGAVVPEAMMAFTNALSVDKQNPRARFYIGLAESQIGNLKQAVAVWRDLEKDAPPNASWLPLVREHITAMGQAGKFDPTTIPPNPPSVAALTAAMTAMSSAIDSKTGAPPAAIAGSASAPATPAAGDVQAPQQAAASTEASSDPQLNMIRGMVAKFAAKMESNPNDVAGWQRLAHFYEVLGERDKQEAALDHVARLQQR